MAIAGFAWAGETDIAGSKISSDTGATWRPAKLTGEPARFAWRRFEFEFTATKPQSYLILSRATDRQRATCSRRSRNGIHRAISGISTTRSGLKSSEGSRKWFHGFQRLRSACF